MWAGMVYADEEMDVGWMLVVFTYCVEGGCTYQSRKTKEINTQCRENNCLYALYFANVSTVK